MHLLKGSEALFFSSFSHFTHWGSKKVSMNICILSQCDIYGKCSFATLPAAHLSAAQAADALLMSEKQILCAKWILKLQITPLSSLNYDMHFALDLLQPIPSLWLLTKCITSQVQPTARYTAVALRTVFQKSCCKRLSPILVPYRRSASSRTRDTHLSGNTSIYS